MILDVSRRKENENYYLKPLVILLISARERIKALVQGSREVCVYLYQKKLEITIENKNSLEGSIAPEATSVVQNQILFERVLVDAECSTDGSLKHLEQNIITLSQIEVTTSVKILR